MGSIRRDDADIPAAAVRAAALRTHAPETRPQRTPRFPDTPWGRLRRQMGWSLRELAAESGINTAELSRIERGLGPTPDRAIRLLRAYAQVLG